MNRTCRLFSSIADIKEHNKWCKIKRFTFDERKAFLLLDIKPPENSPYKLEYDVQIHIDTQNWPFSMPKVIIPDLYHANIGNNQIFWYCNPDEWSPAITISSICLMTQMLLGEGCIEDYLVQNTEAFLLWNKNSKAFENLVEGYRRYWSRFRVIFQIETQTKEELKCVLRVWMGLLYEIE